MYNILYILHKKINIQKRESNINKKLLNIIYIYVGDERTPELLLGFAGTPQLCNLD